MKIGILTFHDADNYGAVLQAYALKETVKSIIDAVEIIDYKQPYILKPYKMMKIIYWPLKALTKSIISNLIYAYPNLIKKIKFNKFRKKYCDLTNKVYTDANDIAGKDIYIVGSDQVWNMEITKYDKAYFLNFCKKNERKIAFAASLGKSNLTEQETLFLKENIKGFDFLSVREDSARDILLSLTNKEVTHVLDPTLLADLSIWKNIMSNSKHEGKYMLVYLLSNKPENLDFAQMISNKLNLEVLNIGGSILNNPYDFKSILGVGPCDFITLFKGASFILTDSFHGTAFSIIFNKNFITITHKTRGTRMLSLLNILNLNNRLIFDSKTLCDDFDFNIDYSIPNKLLQNEKQKSMDFLATAINSVRTQTAD